MTPAPIRSDHLRLLLQLDGRRAVSSARRPTWASALGVLLPVAVVASALWVLGRIGVPATAGAEGGVTLGLLVSGGVSFLAYGILFGSRDQTFLRELGVRDGSLYLERGLRLLVAALAAAAAVTLPFLAAGEDVGRPLAIAISAGALAAGVAVLTYAWAARATTAARVSPLLSAGLGKFDAGLAKAAPLVYAPLLPFLVSAGYGGLAGAASGAPWAHAVAALALAGVALHLGRLLFEDVAPRFLPRVGEMAYTPPPEGGGEEFRVGRGLSALLPRRAAAAWVRDATLAGRRFAWASRVSWPVAGIAIVALARWGDAASTRAWVLSAVGLALLIQSAAVVGLGLLERDGRRWLDRSLGLHWTERFLGRWAWAWGLSLWLLVPVALAWTWWSGAGPAWRWPLAGAAVAALATTASLLNAERR
ncbi:MAG TPA: hypothetical protein VMN39_12530 [Longimicrobiaceae bacterium]|nr:hypothetical protein [Longimicrobiaceae bacterium]